MREIKFEDIKDRLLEELKKRIERFNFGETVTLRNGIINQPFRDMACNDLVIGGTTIPTIVLTGDETGRIYLVSLGAILPDLFPAGVYFP